MLSNLLIFGGARGRGDAGGCRPENPARYRQRSREASRRHRKHEQAQRKHYSFDGPQEAIFFGHRALKKPRPIPDSTVNRRSHNDEAALASANGPIFSTIAKPVAEGPTARIRSIPHRKQ
jgi:hypothetical protein